MTLAVGLVINLCACYHPPKPVYDSAAFRDLLFDNISQLLDDDHESVFILTGDLNKLSTGQLQTQLGLVQIMNVPTHNNNILNVLLTNRPDLLDVQVGQSLVKT